MKKKLENFWYYNKWYILFGLMVLTVIVNFFGERVQLVEADAVISIVTLQDIPEETVEDLRRQVAAFADDSNGDGIVEIEINVYSYDSTGTMVTDADTYAAAAVHLAAELEMKLAVFYITDDPQLLAQRGDLEQLGVWADYSLLRQIDSQYLSEFSIFAFPEGDRQILESLK